MLLSSALGGLYPHCLLSIQGLDLNILPKLAKVGWRITLSETDTGRDYLNVEAINVCEIKLSLEHMQGPVLIPTLPTPKPTPKSCDLSCLVFHPPGSAKCGLLTSEFTAWKQIPILLGKAAGRRSCKLLGALWISASSALWSPWLSLRELTQEGNLLLVPFSIFAWTN